MNELQVFNNEEFGEIRTIEENGNVLFCGSDVAKALGYSKARNAINAHCKGALKRGVLTNGGKQEMTFIPEGDLYRLIAHSKLPSAEKFESWVFDEVLPTIRKTGTYTVQKTDKRLDIMDRNARTRQANLLMKMADVDTLSKEYKNILVSKATEILTGTQLIPLAQSTQKGYLATDIGNMFGVSAQRIGKIGNANNLKTEEFGQWYHSKSEYSPKEVDTFVYNDRAVDEFRRILGN